MEIAVLKESKPGENRVALTPDVVKTLVKKGYQVCIESGAGDNSYFSDMDYMSVGAEIKVEKSSLQSRCYFKNQCTYAGRS
jgi:NAD(P) transhydrogenase subunit alpha